MKMIPLFKCGNMKEAINFYTDILDFELKYPNEVSDDDWVVDLINGDAELQLTKKDPPFTRVLLIKHGDGENSMLPIPAEIHSGFVNQFRKN